MARINIETSIYAKHEFQELMIRVGDRQKAKGMAQELWELAQRFWFPHKRLIPITEVRKLGLQPVIDSGLAEVDPSGDFVRALGSEEAFAWLFSASEKGKKGGLASAEKKKKIPSKSKGKVSSTGKQGSTSEHHSEASLLSSPSSLLPIQSLNSNSQEDAAAPVPRWDAGVFIGEYVQVYRKRYGETAKPDLGKKIQGLIKRFVAENTRDRATALIHAYLEMGDQWFITKGHDFVTFLGNLSKVGLKVDTGRMVTRGEARRSEVSDTNKQAVRDYLKTSEAS